MTPRQDNSRHVRSRGIFACVTGGFTLIELLVTLSIVGILATIAVPSFTRLLDKMRLASATDDYIAALYGTRSYAVRDNTKATLCPSKDGKSCSNSSDLSVGWLILSENKGPVRYWSAPGATIKTNYKNNAVDFHPNGQPNAAGHASFCVGAQAGKVFIAPAGRVRYTSCDECGCGDSP